MQGKPPQSICAGQAYACHAAPLPMRAQVHTSSTLPIAFLLLDHSCLRDGSAQLMRPYPVGNSGSSGCNTSLLKSLGAKAAGSLWAPQGLNPGHACKTQNRWDRKGDVRELVVEVVHSADQTACKCRQMPSSSALNSKRCPAHALG